MFFNCFIELLQQVVEQGRIPNNTVSIYPQSIKLSCLHFQRLVINIMKNDQLSCILVEKKLLKISPDSRGHLGWEC